MKPWVNSSRLLAVCSVLVLLAACSSPSGPTTDPSGEASQGADDGTAADDDSSGGDDEADEEAPFKPDNPCTLISDDALTVALGSPPLPAEPILGGSNVVCQIYGSATDAYLSVDMDRSGRDGFEASRGYIEESGGTAEPLPGIGDDAFAFGSEVRVLVGVHVVKLYLSGLAFDAVPQADRLELTKTLALEVAKELG